MNELNQLFSEQEIFETDIEKDTFIDVILAKMAFQEYVRNRVNQIVLSDTQFSDTVN